jgi:hypothetical protein
VYIHALEVFLFVVNELDNGSKNPDGRRTDDHDLMHQTQFKANISRNYFREMLKSSNSQTILLNQLSKLYSNIFAKVP